MKAVLRIGLFVALGFLGACKTIYRDSDTGFSVRIDQPVSRGAGFERSAYGIDFSETQEGEEGTLSLAVIEYVIGAAEGPFATYYDAAIQIENPPTEISDDLQALEPVASRLAGASPPTGRHYARALGQKLAPHVAEALERDGAANLLWGLPLDVDRRAVKLASQRRKDTIMTTLFLYPDAQMVVIHSDSATRLFAWDLALVSGAFDPQAQLTHELVAERVEALHVIGALP